MSQLPSLEFANTDVVKSEENLDTFFFGKRLEMLEVDVFAKAIMTTPFHVNADFMKKCEGLLANSAAFV